jgi:hypothetical protein
MKRTATIEIDPRELRPVSVARTIKMSEVSPLPIEWLWRYRIALGKLTVVAGDPGLGKSMLTTACFAAHVTTGRAWPDGSACPIGSVVIVSGEDDPGDTIRPRLDIAGADVERVHYLQCLEDEDGERSFTLADVVPLADLLDVVGDCRLLVIDPVSAYLADTDSHKNSEVRAKLMPLAQMAAERRVAVVAVSHLNKAQAGSALSRVTGSLAFVAAARAAYVVTRDVDDPARRLLLPIKNNLGNDQTGFAYRIGEANGVPYVSWDKDVVTISADQALSPIETRRSVRNDACEFLTSLLADGVIPVDAIRSEAKSAGHSWATMRRAKDEIGARSMRSGFENGGWAWYLPGKKMLKPSYTQLSTFGKSEHLRGLGDIEDAEGAQGAQLAHTIEREHLGDCSAVAYAGRRGE